MEMFLEQAVRQFEIWTGDRAPRALMERAALEALGGAHDAAARPGLRVREPAPCGTGRDPAL